MTSITSVTATEAQTSTTGPDPGTTAPTTTGGTETTGEPSTDPTTTPTTTTSGCVPDCPEGQYCAGDSCQPGCDGDEDCTAPATCDLADHTCKGCSADAACPLGQVCKDGACVPGCNDMQPCESGLACCAEACVDPLNDPAHCGGCEPCPALPNAEASCAMGQCGLGACAAGFADCDNNPNNGCETQGECQCSPGATEACYSGPGGTQDVGICKGGMHTCNPEGTGWGPCDGEVLPGATDICSNGLDDDCDGQVDEDADNDGDGWTVCGGDCCDEIGPTCLNPDLVNPGAFEVLGNTVDDDCDGMQDNALPACDGGLPSNSSDALQYARAIDLCQFTTENPPIKDKKWGVISGGFSRSNGAGSPANAAKSIRPGFGTVIVPQKNASLAVLSTGNAADANDAMPAYSAFQGGTQLGTSAAVPADWLAANGNNFPNAPGCPAPQGGATGQDTIQLKLRIRVPTNALSFSAYVYFFSSEYPEWVCSPYNDFFLTLVDGQGAGNPADKNVAIYKNQNDQLFPLGVNILKGAPGLFTQCKNGQISCGYPPAGTYNSCTGNAELAGTGFHLTNPAPQFGNDPGYCGSNNQVGGGTGWLKMSGNVKPGETMEIRFVLWDTGDPWYDSLVLLDNFEWSLQASQPGVKPG
ncbi:Putative metal-binding motif-containing protein [Nannocystis exedens]|uniref:Putative metal-binding motif-containing protein n=1 Tax=Nannocystis exedens TaxID=54 RepID=A0A1I2F7R0_9BACT|nr:choice-of-anchor L domain-containing protein [Nannocystis exedens]PCC73063.1 Protein metal binding site [Nannocystis exedens]SFF00788.1 Putative metal-binding motif-containing protein [Nannocystis exedens]